MPLRHPLYLVDAFVRGPFSGNPAAVCLLREPGPDATLQAVAAELNVSETAFVQAPDGDLFASDAFDLRWFSPTREVPLCGHATLATAKVLYDELGLAVDPLVFRTASGSLQARSRSGGIEIDLPRAVLRPAERPAAAAELLGGPMPEEAVEDPVRGYLLLRYASAADVTALRPSFPELVRRLPSTHLVIATAPGTPPHDFVSRCFAPLDGIDEDPVTGAAHTALGPFWADRLGRTGFSALQLSRRGGELAVELEAPDRVRLRGRAHIVLRGYLDLPR